MSETKHTPGPWELGTADENMELEIAGAGEPSPIVARVNTLPMRLERPAVVGCGTLTPEANARLIAAAPDLLAACKAALPYLQKHSPTTWAMARAAIAQAEGERGND